MPRGEDGQIMNPPKGFDVYTIRVTAVDSCEIEPVCLWVSDRYTIRMDKSDPSQKQRVGKGETVSFSVSADQQGIDFVAPSVSMKGVGLLECRVNGKRQYVEIVGWKEIFPQ